MNARSFKYITRDILNYQFTMFPIVLDRNTTPFIKKSFFVNSEHKKKQSTMILKQIIVERNL